MTIKRVPPLRTKFNQAADERRLAAHSRKAYARWISEFVRLYHPHSPYQLGPKEIATYLTFLVSKRKVSASTQMQALNALTFFFRYVLCKEIGNLPSTPRGLVKVRKNHALTRSEFRALMLQIPKNLKLVFLLQYGCGMRIAEVVNLKIRDILWSEALIELRETKSRNDRTVRIPKLLLDPLLKHIGDRRQWTSALEKKRYPGESKSAIERRVSQYWDTQHLFVSSVARYDNISNPFHLQPLSTSYLQRVFKRARNAAGISRR